MLLVMMAGDDDDNDCTLVTRDTAERVPFLFCPCCIQEAADVCIYPYYSNDGGLESERTYVKQIVQKFIPDENLKSDNMFDENDTVKS